MGDTRLLSRYIVSNLRRVGVGAYRDLERALDGGALPEAAVRDLLRFTQDVERERASQRRHARIGLIR